MKSFFLGALLFVASSSLARSIHFDLEQDLIKIFDHPELYSREKRAWIADKAACWIQVQINGHATGRIALCKDDESYLGRIVYMAASIMNWSEWEED